MKIYLARVVVVVVFIVRAWGIQVTPAATQLHQSLVVPTGENGPMPVLFKDPYGCKHDHLWYIDMDVRSVNYSAVAANGAGCRGPGSFEEFPSLCSDSSLDDTDFTASEMCCECGGGKPSRCMHWGKYWNHAFVGTSDDVVGHVGVSFEQCEMLCQADGRCDWFMYGEANYCETWLVNHSRTDLSEMYGYDAYHCIHQHVRCLGFEEHNKTAFLGDADILVGHHGSSFTECRLWCEIDPNCTWFTYQHEIQYCEVWSGVKTYEDLKTTKEFQEFNTYKCVPEQNSLLQFDTKASDREALDEQHTQLTIGNSMVGAGMLGRLRGLSRHTDRH